MIYLQLFTIYCQIGLIYTVVAFIRHPGQFHDFKNHTLGECIPIFIVACLTWPWRFVRRWIGQDQKPKNTNV